MGRDIDKLGAHTCATVLPPTLPTPVRWAQFPPALMPYGPLHIYLDAHTCLPPPVVRRRLFMCVHDVEMLGAYTCATMPT